MIDEEEARDDNEIAKRRSAYVGSRVGWVSMGLAGLD